MSALLIYLMSLADGVGSFAIAISCISIIILAILIIAHCVADYDDNEIKKNSEAITITSWIFVISALICILIPSPSYMAMMYVVPKISNSDFAKKIPPKLEQLINKKLDDWIKDDK